MKPPKRILAVDSAQSLLVVYEEKRLPRNSLTGLTFRPVCLRLLRSVLFYN